MADDDRTPSRAARGGRRAGSGEAKVNEVSVQPPPDDTEGGDKAAAAKAQAVGGEGTVTRSDAVAAAQAGNEEVAERYQVEQQQGWWGENPTADRNSDATYAGQVEFLQKSKEERDRIRRERHVEDRERAAADDWS